jgi:hypothetical protein
MIFKIFLPQQLEKKVAILKIKAIQGGRNT